MGKWDLKTQSQFLASAGQGSPNFTEVNTETFSYDPNLDYLTGANYGDGLANATPCWSYDVAGNRNDSVCDNLNRTNTIGGISTTCDILGNRTTYGSTTYTWDCLNRMTGNSTGYNYTYRADGMRVDKNNPTTTNGVAFRYDGQMTFEDYAYAGANATQINDYGLGARGVNYIARTSSAQTVVGFPLYDAHGDMTACLFPVRPGGTYTIGNQREYDAWGIIRSGATTGDPRGRYCASLGHKQDDETLFVYMRARYYDPYSGRFISQDNARNGWNYFAYAANDPCDLADETGCSALGWVAFTTTIIAELLTYFPLQYPVVNHVVATIGLIITAIAVIQEGVGKAFLLKIIDAQTIQLIVDMRVFDESAVGVAAQDSLAGPAVDACEAEAGEAVGEFLAEDVDEWNFDGE